LGIHEKRTIIILVIIAIVAIPIALYTILPLFTNKVVDEPLPTASGMTLTVFENEKFIEKKG
jgi:flagellar basal body-associated protein FliL